MPGVMIFTSLGAAIRAGFSVYDRTAEGYLVRQRTDAGYALAIVRMRGDHA